MKKTVLLLFLISLSSLAFSQSTVDCTIKTTLGSIQIELYPEKAPITVNNFLVYIDKGAYESSSFFRVCTPENEANRAIKIEVIQGGNIKEEDKEEPVTLETTEITGLLHLDGMLSMARSAPHTATSQFFICVGDQPTLDYAGARNSDGQGFAVFGRVTDGMEVVRKIQGMKNQKQRLDEPVQILNIVRK